MKAWEIEEIRRAVKGKWLMRNEAGAGAGGRRFNGRVCTDSRKAATDELFFALVGKTHDAHVYVKDVIERGVAAVVIHKEPAAEILTQARKNAVTIILVDDTIAALNRLAAAYRSGGPAGGLRAKVIAIGGSNGKTTTKRIIHALLAQKFGPHAGLASPKSFNNNIGMPLTLLEVEPSHEYVVLEIGTNAPGEIAALGEVCRPDIAVITSVGLEHLEKLGNLEGVAREEASIAPFVADGGTLVLPADAAELLQAVKNTQAKRVLVGRDDGAPGDLVLTQVFESMMGTAFSINGRGNYRLPLVGAHNAMNALMAIAVARRLGMNSKQINAALAKVTGAAGRFEVLQTGDTGWRVINDAYNANPSSMEAALKTFARLRGEVETDGGRRVVVLGDMLELGSFSQALHHAVGQMVAAWGFDLFVAVGPAMQFAADAAEAAGGRVVRFRDTAAARTGILQHLDPGDCILLKGSRGMALETILTTLQSASPAPAVA